MSWLEDYVKFDSARGPYNEATHVANLTPPKPQGPNSLLSGKKGRTQDEYIKFRDELNNTIKNSRGIDEQARTELLGLFSTTKVDDISTQYEAMLAGDGKYGARKKNLEHQLLLNNRPGAVQLFGSSQGRSAAQNGLLTTSTTDGLLTGSGFNRG